jgi:hypothetical protein
MIKNVMKSNSCRGVCLVLVILLLALSAYLFLCRELGYRSKEIPASEFIALTGTSIKIPREYFGWMNKDEDSLVPRNDRIYLDAKNGQPSGTDSSSISVMFMGTARLSAQKVRPPEALIWSDEERQRLDFQSKIYISTMST